MNSNFVSNRTIALAAGGILLFVLGVGLGHIVARDGGAERPPASAPAVKQLYTCGMHPNVVQEGPGACPICHMDLVPLRGAPAAAEGDGGGLIAIDPAVVQNIGVRTAAVERGPLEKTVRATGVVVEDETRVGVVSLKIDGWIEKVHVDQTGVRVARGDPLLEIYSPELVTTEQEYLIASDNLRRLEGSAPAAVVRAARDALAAARSRLLYWDIADDQIEELERTRAPRKTMLLRSPFTGVVTMKSALPGMRVMPGMDIYRIADLGVVWVQASVFEADIPFVSVGQGATMTLSFLPGRAFEGRATFLAPVVDPVTRDLKVRLEFPNPGGDLRPGMYAEVALEAVLDADAVLVPGEAVIRTGARDVVFVDEGGGRFYPVEVRLGAEGADGRAQVLAGLDPGDRVVTSAQFLLDSESSFREAVNKMRADALSAPAAPAAPNHSGHGEP